MNPLHQSRLRHLRQVQALALFAAFGGVALASHVSTALLWIGALLVACVPSWNRAKILAPVWAAMIVSAFLPFDIRFENRPGPPHFARLVMGLALRRDRVAKYHTDVVMGGCTATGFEPTWVWVW